MEKENINDLISKVKSSIQPKTIQKIIPIIKNTKEEEIQFSFYLPKSLLKNIKQKALDENQSIKITINKVLETYFKQ
ncbi:hypothetical protein [Polaribacter butkevichii]|uniref:CopG family transcriptional regulator n=1 Tax=Polaribacter butkevichii TaxID=218490 RepID=A0A2P6CCY7_9FLAO|nr:hypothetical protein [Polaribacter butkevichii]PQJ72776.1 hypothetical protein BTO14_05675 [Polaribacter butkevichii]